MDEALIATFPASDPVAIAIERDIRHRQNSPPTAALAHAALDTCYPAAHLDPAPDVSQREVWSLLHLYDHPIL